MSPPRRWRSRLRRRRRRIEELLRVLHIRQHLLRRETAPLEELLAQLSQKRPVHPIPARVVAAETIQNNLHFINVLELSRVNEQLELLADAQVKRREPDVGLQPARAGSAGDDVNRTGGEFTDRAFTVGVEK